jgi:hypothetical protein
LSCSANATSATCCCRIFAAQFSAGCTTNISAFDFRQARVFFAAQSWAACTTNMFGFDFRQTRIPCENWPVKVGGRPRWQCGGGSPAGPSRRVPGAGTPLSVMLDAGMSGTGRNARLGRSFLWLEHRGKGPAPDRLDRGRPWAPPPVISDLGVPPGHQRSRRGRQL